MSGVHSDGDSGRDDDGRSRIDGGVERHDDRLRTDGGTEDEDAVEEIKQMLSEGDDDGDLAEAVTGDDEDDEFESGPAMNFGLKIGAPFALVAVGLLFVGPQPLLAFDPQGKYIIDTLDVGGPGNIVYISGLTLVLSLLAGLFYPLLADEVDDEFKMDLGLGISLPTIGVMGLLLLFFMLWPVIFALLNGALIEAGIYLVVVVVLIGIALAGSIITLAIAAVATLYFVGPALIGSYVGGFVGELLST